MLKVSLQGVLTSVDRHKLFLLTNKGNPAPVDWLLARGVPIINVGKKIAEFVKGVDDMSYLPFETYEHLKTLLETGKQRMTTAGNEVVAIYNLGVLLEPLLELDPVKLLKDFSKSAALIIIWEHKIANNILTWDTQQNKYFFDFSEIQLKYIDNAL